MIAAAQETSLSGNVRDSSQNSIPVKAVVALLRPEDSTLYQFTRLSDAGTFSFTGLAQNKYLLMVTYPGYVAYLDEILLTDKKHNSLKTIHIQSPAKILNEIVLTQSDYVFRNDTLELNLKNATLGPNSTVEDLLRQLPGVFVDRNGNITAFGQRIEKIFVDGEEFFSDDPTVAIKNLRAGDVKKVQVFDKSSEKAQITGTIDGKMQKSMNIELKNDAKKGYFGLAEAGGSPDYYHGRALVNAFRQKRKLSAFALAGNTAENGFTEQEADNYGFSNKKITVDEGSGTIFKSSGDDPNFNVSNFADEGLPESIRGGIHYSNVFGNAKTANNYLFNRLDVVNNSSLIRQNILPDSMYYNFEQGKSHQRNDFQGVKTKWTVQPDSTLRLDMAGIFGVGNKRGVMQKTGQTFSQNLDTLSQNARNNEFSGEFFQYKVEATLTKKLNTRQSISVHMQHGQTGDRNRSQFKYMNKFRTNIMLRADTIHQKRNKNQQIRQFQTALFFNQKLSGKARLEMNYAFFSLGANEEKLVFQLDSLGYYSRKISTLSNEFTYRYDIHTPGLILHQRLKKGELSAGTRLAHITYSPQNVTGGPSDARRDFVLLPTVSFRTAFGDESHLKLALNSETRQPQSNQIQPVQTLDDPANVFEGNPNLKYETAHSLQLDFSNYQMAKERYLFLTSQVTFVKDQIAVNFQSNQYGQKILRFGNHNGWEGLLAAGYNFKVERVRLGVGPALTYAQFTNKINDISRTSHSWIAALRLNAGYTTNFFSVNGQVAPEYYLTTYGETQKAKTNLGNLKIMMYSTFYLPWKLELGADVLAYLRQKLPEVELNNNVVLLNAFLEKRLFANEALALRLSVNDLLNQNRGFTRDIFSVYTEEKRFQTFKRYVLLKLTYHLSRGKKQNHDEAVEF